MILTEIPPEVEPGVITDLLCYEVETVGRRGVERRPAVLVLLVHLGAVLYEQPHHHQVVVQHRLEHEVSVASAPCEAGLLSKSHP